MNKILLFLILAITSSSFSQNNYLLAESYYREGKYEKSAQVFKKLHAKTPFNNTYLSRLVSCYQETEQFLEAEKLLKAKLKKTPQLGFLYVHLGYNYERQQLKERATKNYNLALKSIDKNPTYGGVIARVFNNYSLLDNAILAYEKLVTKNANYNLQIARIYGEKGDFKKMFTSYLDLVDKNTNYYSTVQRYTSAYINEDPENETNILFKKALLRKSVSNPKDVWNTLLSWLFTQQKQYNKAFIQEKALFKRNPKDLSAIFSLGTIAFNNKDHETAESIFNFIVENAVFNEEKINAHLYNTQIAIAKNKKDIENLFESLLKEFGKNAATIKLQVAYADFLTFQENKPEEAKKVLENALDFSKSKFDKARIKLKLGDILVFTEKYNKALIYFSQIQTQLKNHELAQQARFKVAQTSYFKGDFTWAKAQLKVLKGSTTQLIANDAVALFLTITDNEPVDSIPSGLTQYAKAALLAFQNKTQQAIDTLNSIDTKFKGQPIEDESFFKKAALYTKLGKFKEAILNYKTVITLNPEGILIDDAYYELAELYNTQLNNSEKASEYYQKIIFDHPSSIYLVDARKKYRKLRGDTL